MKVILSRKGFDNQYGGQPSPILPDGTLLSLPIPMVGEEHSFGDLSHNSLSYFEIIGSLNPKTKLTKNTKCHLDPDIRKGVTERNNDWKPLFGQADSSLTHLTNNTVGKNDLFLFFGTFRETEIIGNQIKYKKNSPDIHLMYGYFQVKELHTDSDYLKEHFAHHPHANGQFLDKNQNGIFEPNERLSFDGQMEGSGVFSFNKELILTKDGLSKSRWELPEFFREAKISYHSNNSFKENYLQSAAKGQEFIISQSTDVEEWSKRIIEKGTNKFC